MNPINNNYVEFATAIEKGVPIGINDQGNWYREGIFWRFVRWLFPSINDSALLKVAKVFNETLEKIERQPDLRIPEIFERAANSLSLTLRSSQSEELQSQLSQLRARKVGLLYRTSERPSRVGDGSVTFIAEALEQLKEKAAEWIAREELFERDLLPEEIEKLKEAACYHWFSELILADESVRVEFFKWAIRDDCDDEQFIKFPAVSIQMRSGLLSNRIGRHALDQLAIVQENDLLLTFEGEKISVLDQNRQITFSRKYTVTVAQVEECFKKKNVTMGHFEVFGIKGICNWNSHELGPWDPSIEDYDRISVDRDGWWELIPNFEVLSVGALERRYEVTVTSDSWVVMASATRQSIKSDLDKCHGYMVVAIPKDGEYVIYPMGKFARHFPQTDLQKTKFLADTVDAVISIPDENESYGQRQKAYHPIIWSKEQGQRLMQLVARDIMAARGGNLIFQFTWEGCAYWPQTLIKEVDSGTPQFFLSPVMMAYPSNPALKYLFKFFRSLPEGWQVGAVLRVIKNLGASRRKKIKLQDGTFETKSVVTSPFMEHAQIYNPSFLHQQIRDGILTGLITNGHTELRTKTWPRHSRQD